MSTACDRTPPAVERPQTPQAPASAVSAAPVASASAAPPPAPVVMGEGDAKIPFEFPQVPMSAPRGSYVLAPPRAWIDAGLEKGAGKQTYIYYGGWLREPGPAASEVETLAKQMAVIPNSLIVAIPPGAHARPGQVLLTSWASGTGMQRAIVVEGGSEASPMVRYLDMSLDSPTGWGKRADTLAENTFMLLEEPGAVGTTAACREGNHRMRYIVTAVRGDRLLGYGFAGKIAAFKRDDCQFAPLRSHFKKDDHVYVPVVGRYMRAKVRRVDAELGRLWARYKTEDEDQVGAFALIDVLRQLD